MIYAIRTTSSGSVLVELKSHKHLSYVSGQRSQYEVRYNRVSSAEARRWVKDRRFHETGLWVDDGVVRYAAAVKEA